MTPEEAITQLRQANPVPANVRVSSSASDASYRDALLEEITLMTILQQDDRDNVKRARRRAPLLPVVIAGTALAAFSVVIAVEASDDEHVDARVTATINDVGVTPPVAIGSYPQYGVEGPFKVIITIEGEDSGEVAAVALRVEAACDGVRTP